jgi:hypothetical protein
MVLPKVNTGLYTVKLSVILRNCFKFCATWGSYFTAVSEINQMATAWPFPVLQLRLLALKSNRVLLVKQNQLYFPNSSFLITLPFYLSKVPAHVYRNNEWALSVNLQSTIICYPPSPPPPRAVRVSVMPLTARQFPSFLGLCFFFSLHGQKLSVEECKQSWILRQNKAVYCTLNICLFY